MGRVGSRVVGVGSENVRGRRVSRKRRSRDFILKALEDEKVTTHKKVEKSRKACYAPRADASAQSSFISPGHDHETCTQYFTILHLAELGRQIA